MVRTLRNNSGREEHWRREKLMSSHTNSLRPPPSSQSHKGLWSCDRLQKGPKLEPGDLTFALSLPLDAGCPQGAGTALGKVPTFLPPKAIPGDGLSYELSTAHTPTIRQPGDRGKRA